MDDPRETFWGLKAYGDGRKDVVLFRDAELDPHVEVREVSPGGAFAWGYTGKGPFQLAIAILCETLGPAEARALYEGFCREVVAEMPRDADWRLTKGEVRDALARVRDGRPVWFRGPEEAKATYEPDAPAGDLAYRYWPPIPPDGAEPS